MPEPADSTGALASGLKRLAAGLGLERFGSAGCRLSGAELAGDNLRLDFFWDGVGAATVTVADDDGPAFARSKHLAFRLVAVNVSRPWAVLMARMAIEAGDMSMDDLIAMSCLGDTPAEIAPVDSPAIPFNPVTTWGQDDGWRQFVCDSAMERRFREAFEFDSDSSFIVHGDLECRFVAPGARVRLPGHFVYPFDLFSHTEAVGPVTDLDDRDVILDPSKKIESRVLREARAGVIKGPLVVLATCVPVVIAEDPGPVLARLAPVCPAGISYVTPVSPKSPSETFMASFGELRKEVLERAPEAGSVGLVGYRPGRGLDDLEALLSDAGLKVGGAIVPLVTRGLLTRVLASETIVIAPGRYHEGIFDSLVEGASDAGRQVMRPEFPWGVDATCRWLEQVAAATGDSRQVAKVCEDASAAARATIERIRPRDAVFLFVTDVSGLSRLVDTNSPAGLALLPVMRDMGLRSRVLVYCAGADISEARARFNEVIAGIEGLRDVEFGHFSDEAGLSRALHVADAGAVYSEMFFDYRATRSGLPVFSSRIFEPGFKGAVRTVQRFRRLAGLPYYRKYLSRAEVLPVDSLV